MNAEQKELVEDFFFEADKIYLRAKRGKDSVSFNFKNEALSEFHIDQEDGEIYISVSFQIPEGGLKTSDKRNLG